MEWGLVRRAYRTQLCPCARIYYIAHCLLGGSGACSPRKRLKFRLCESVSEAVGDHYNHAKFVATGV